MVNYVTFEFYEVVGDKLLDVSVYKETPGGEFRYDVSLNVVSDELKVLKDGDEHLMHESGKFTAETMENFFEIVTGILKPFYQAIKS